MLRGSERELRTARDGLRSTTEASGFLVGPAVFKTVEGATSSLAGSIPVRLRSKRSRLAAAHKPITVDRSASFCVDLSNWASPVRGRGGKRERPAHHEEG